MDIAPHQRISILRDDVARRIAAGEVIDRPAAVLRELIDNAIDAGAGEIECFLEQGGSARVRVIDNGCGLDKEDLALAAHSHATSKISSLEDLDRLSTLGFRGEALASIAACARLEITSAPRGKAGSAFRLLVEGGKQLGFKPCQGNPGTVVDASNLFFNMPARKKFLKRSQTESAVCRNVFLDKALAFPATGFRLWVDGKLKDFFPPGRPLERVQHAYKDSFDTGLMEETQCRGEGFSITALCGRPELVMRDRRFIQIFVNRRRIWEYSLLQAVEYGYTGCVPGGLKPVAFVFIDIDPAFVDFNIHPAKREARFRNLPLIHNALVVLVKNLLAKHKPDADAAFIREGPEKIDNERSSQLFFKTGEFSSSVSKINQAFFQSIGQRPLVPSEKTADVSGIRYLGRCFGVYLAAMAGDELVLVDQHAAHERILYDELLDKKQPREELLIPLSFSLETDEAQALEQNLCALAELGFQIEKAGLHSFEIRAMPQDLSGIPEQELILFLKGESGAFADLKQAVTSLVACRKAIKDGDELDPLSAQELIRRALALPEARCPHGRPVYIRFSRDELDKLFKRKV